MTQRPMINEALRLVRLYWGYSQGELAARLQVSQSLVSDVESGKKGASLDLIEKYSDVLGIKMSQIMFFAESVGDQPVERRGKLIIAEHVLRLLERMKPSEREGT